MLTKKDLLKAIEDMPMDAPIKAIVRLGNYKNLILPSLRIEKQYGTILLINNNGFYAN